MAAIMQRVNPLLHRAQRLGYAARAKELQVETAGLLAAAKDEISGLKSVFVAEQDEPAANLLLSMELILDAFCSELHMWAAIKEDKMGDAWSFLIDAQGAVAQAVQVHDAAAAFLEYAEKLVASEYVLFPPQKFMSAGMVVSKSECSICRQDYDACDHIKGTAYMGQVCVRVIKECDLEEISIVDEPADRRCRILTITDYGVTRDSLTWRAVKRSESEPAENG